MLSHMVIARAQFDAERVNLTQAGRSSCAVHRVLRDLGAGCSRATDAARHVLQVVSIKWPRTGTPRQR